MQVSSLDKINYLNIGLMILSAVLAVIMPFELFLFAYAVLGPLHYLTEISWLHDKNYYTKFKFDPWILGIITLWIALPVIGSLFGIRYSLKPQTLNHLLYLSVALSVIFVFINKLYYRIIALVLAFLTFQFADNYFVVLSVFLPTLIHVFIFTALFLLYGALKSRSYSGYISFIVLVLCPVIIINFYPVSSYRPSNFDVSSYRDFEMMNYYSLKHFLNVECLKDNWLQTIYYSKPGVLIMRGIAYAYTYHYLNWFSKTKVIRWHEIPKSRFILIISLWLLAIISYAYNYSTGFKCLFFLSFLHVILELPLNVVSIKGIFKETGSIFSNQNV